VAETRWVFTYKGKRYSEGDLKAREVEQVEDITELRYGALRPMLEMGHRLAYIAVVLLRDHSAADVETILADISLVDVEKMWTTEEDDLPVMFEDGIPSSVGEPSTPTS
jgi:hypothetical protein